MEQETERAVAITRAGKDRWKTETDGRATDQKASSEQKRYEQRTKQHLDRNECTMKHKVTNTRYPASYFQEPARVQATGHSSGRSNLVFHRTPLARNVQRMGCSLWSCYRTLRVVVDGSEGGDGGG